MGRRKLAADEGKSGTLAIRVKPALLADLDAAVEARSCNRSELVVGLLEAAFDAGLAAAVVDKVEQSKVRKLTELSRDDVVKRLQEVENERTLLTAALTAMSQ